MVLRVKQFVELAMLEKVADYAKAMDMANDLLIQLEEQSGIMESIKVLTTIESNYLLAKVDEYIQLASEEVL